MKVKTKYYVIFLFLIITLNLEVDDGKEDHKIIAIPTYHKESFMLDSIPISVKFILKTWFSNYKGVGKMQFISWGDKKEALNEIKKWQL